MPVTLPHPTPAPPSSGQATPLLSRPGSRDQGAGGAVCGIRQRTMRYPGLAATVEHMTKLALDGAADVRVRAAAIAITSKLRKDPLTGLPDRRDRDAIARAVYEWMVKTVAYVRDPVDTEWLQAPHVTLHTRAGDCDDHAMLSAALLGALGVQTRFRLVGSGSQPTHVLAEFQTGTGVWAPFDTTMARGVGYFPAVPLGYDEATHALPVPQTLATLDGGPNGALPGYSYEVNGRRYEVAVGHIDDEPAQLLPAYVPTTVPLLADATGDVPGAAAPPSLLLLALAFGAGFLTARATDERVPLAKRI